ncbi:uncharacterized mitochondrial protein AtMg00810-like [Aristolochia californica]|uniref:uncharacterized mitochondrial protein AtMg00810-like n=1 Tax=Aristolochia californica TaxID=171875 RepID=UPI0035DE7ABD
MENPSKSHMKAARRILRYLKGTFDYGMFYSSSNEFNLRVYCDSEYVGDIDDRKNTTGFVFFLGNSAIFLCSKKQPIVILSTCEFEYIAATSFAKGMEYVKSLDQATDILTKSLKYESFQKVRMLIGVAKISSLRGSNVLDHS